MNKTQLPVAFQGAFGANSDLAARTVFPGRTTLPCTTFDDAFAAVKDGVAEFGMIPIDNSIAGRVADVHHLLPKSGLFITGEHFQPIEHRLLGVPGATLETITEVHSHVHALAQCRDYLRSHGLKAVVAHDTAGAAEEVSKRGDVHIAAIAPALAGELYGLVELARDIADAKGNVTRFVVITRDALKPEQESGPVITSMFFRLRSVPAALYNALGGFAKNGINMLKIESYVGDEFQVADFYIEVDAHPEDERMVRALEKFSAFADGIRFLGTYPASGYRSAR
jgi:prephenate dehydratase